MPSACKNPGNGKENWLDAGEKETWPKISHLLSCPLLSKAFRDLITKITTPNSPSSLRPFPFPALLLPQALSPSHMLCTSFTGCFAFLLPLQWILPTSTREEGHDHDPMVVVMQAKLRAWILYPPPPHPQCLNAWHAIFIIQVDDQPSTKLPPGIQWAPRTGRSGGGRWKDASTQ